MPGRFERSIGRGSSRLRREVINMGKDSKGNSRKGTPSYGRGVSQQRLSQKTGSSHAYGGWSKVQKSNGDFRMRRSK